MRALFKVYSIIVQISLAVKGIRSAYFQMSSTYMVIDLPAWVTAWGLTCSHAFDLTAHGNDLGGHLFVSFCTAI